MCIRDRYHTVIFLVAIFIFHWVIKLVKSLRSPAINNVMDLTQRKFTFVENFFYRYIKHWFVSLDKVIRFTFFTVMWAACLQFIHFYVEPSGFMVWNSISVSYTHLDVYKRQACDAPLKLD